MLQFCRKCRGAVSVFLTLILIPTFIFSGVLIDGSRILSAKNVVSGAGDLAMNAALSNYNAELNKTYGLLAMAQTPEEVDAALQDFFEASLNASGVSGEDFAKSLIYLEMVDDSFQATGVEGTQIYQTEVIRQEILEYMKYRAPVTFVDRSVLDRLSDLKEAKKEKEAARGQTDYESSLDDLQELFDKIKCGNDYDPDIEGSGSGGTDFLEKAYAAVYDEAGQKQMLKWSRETYEEITMRSVALWRMNNCQDTEDGSTKELMKKMVALADSCSLSDVDSGTAAALIQMVYIKNAMAGRNPEEVLEGVEKYKTSGEGSDAEGREESDEYKELKTLIENYEEACETLEEGKRKTEQQLDADVSEVYSEIRFQYDQAKKAEECCADILENVEKLERELEKLRGKYETWDEAVKSLKDGESKTAYEENKAEADRLFGPGKIDDAKANLAGFREMVGNDLIFYQEVRQQLENVTFTACPLIDIEEKGRFFGESAAYTDGVKTQAQVEQAGETFMERYFDGNGISLSVENQNVADNAFVKDLKEVYCKKGEPDKARQKEEEKKRNEDLKTQMDKLKDLLLSEKVKGMDVSEMGQGDIPSAWLQAAAESFEADAEPGVEGGLDGKDNRKKVSQSGMDKLDQDDESLDQVSDLLNKLSEGAEHFVEPVILTEYVIEMFSYYTCDMDITNPRSLSRDDLSDNALYRAEVEYILWGSPKATTNVTKTKALIFTINLVFNMCFAFTNGIIKADAFKIAAFFPVGPLAKTAIKCALQTMTALNETVNNLTDLMDGKRAALVKTSNDWDSWLLTKGGTKRDNPPSGISYEEYLWLFVCINMFVPLQQTKLLARTADCIELNMTEKKSNGDNSLKDMYTMLEVEAKVSVDTFFLPKLSGAGYHVKEVDDETFAIPYLGIQGY